MNWIFGLLIFLNAQFSYASVACTQVADSDASGFLDFSEMHKPSASFPTVVLKEKISVPNGKLLLLERMGEMWRSTYNPDGKNHQGDPRYFILALGEKAAREFFFKMLSATSMESPDAELFNYAIKLANEHLRSIGLEEIGVGFYETSSEPVQRSLYADNVRQQKYPVAEEGHYLIHDISLHYGSILIPKVLLEHAARKTEHLLDFFERVRRVMQNENPAAQKIIQNVEDIVKDVFLGHIDAFNGNIILVTIERMHNGAKIESYQPYVLDHIAGSTVANLIELTWMSQMATAISNMPYTEINGQPIISEKDAVRLFKALNLLASNYVRTLSKDMKKGISYSPTDLQKFIDQRIEALKNRP